MTGGELILALEEFSIKKKKKNIGLYLDANCCKMTAC